MTIADNRPVSLDVLWTKVRRLLVASIVCALFVLLNGCAGEQSALAPAGREAASILKLFWWMLGGASVVWCSVVGLTFYAIYLKRNRHYARLTSWIVIGGGVIVPTLLLTILLCFGLSMLPKLLEPAPEGSLVVEVQGVQWWWRVRYLSDDKSPAASRESMARQPIDLANEICVPVNEAIEFRLKSEDVIHAFWIPSLGGKVDMIPGRTTRLVLHPWRTGIYRGVCAEYCGTSHALMNFYVRVVSRSEFDEWLRSQSQPALEPSDPIAQRGQKTFTRNGCGACHTVRGTSAAGSVGPDLTHFGSRHSLAAGVYLNESSMLTTWLRHPDHVKPAAEMPAFHVLGDEQLAELVAYLEQLK
jgi:cytochrome c oxidase subunit II